MIAPCQMLSNPLFIKFKVVLRRVSPMVWRRLLVHSDSSIADFHYANHTIDDRSEHTLCLDPRCFTC